MMKFSNSNIIKTIALCLLLQSHGKPPKADEFYVFNVGQGNCNLFIPKDLNSGIILYDGGSSRKPFDKDMQRKDEDIDTIIKTIKDGFKDRKKKHLEVVVSHADLDHLNLIKNIVKKVSEKIKDLNVEVDFGGPKESYTTGKKGKQRKALIDFVADNNNQVESFYPNDSNTFPENYKMGVDNEGKTYNTRILNWSDTKNTNHDSLVLRISRNTDPKYSVLLTGDATKASFSKTNQEQLESTIMVAPHHGAQTEHSFSPEVMGKIQPKYVIFSSDGVSFSHPAAYTVERYHKLDSIKKDTLLHLVCSPGAIIEPEGLVRLGEAYAYTEAEGKNYIQIYVTKHAIYCTTFGTIKSTLGDTINITTSGISMGIPKNIGSKTLFILTTLFCLTVCVLFYVFDGCIYTMLEFKFAKDDWTSLDPALEICGYEVTNKNRKMISVYNFAMNTVFIVWLYYYRFICRGKIVPTGTLNQT